MPEEDVFWADQVAGKLEREFPDQEQVVQDEKTPSGRIHVGALRGWVIHQILFEAIKERFGKARFLFGVDDFDPLDSIPADFKGKVKESDLGKPLCRVHAPFGNYKNYSESIFGEVAEHFPALGLAPEIYRTEEMYRKGVFNDGIRIALDNAPKINEINARVGGVKKPSEYLPFTPVCEKCGKIMTTQAFDWNGNTVKYRCVDRNQEIKGCGHEGEVSPFNGSGKLTWKIEWIAKWLAFKVSCEFAGKDHYTRGGAREVSEAVAREVFGLKPPYGEGYEFLLLGKQKMSTSLGRGFFAADLLKDLEPKMVRFLFVKTRPSMQLSFDPATNAIPFLYDEYDKIERVYFGAEPEENERARKHLKRVYEFSHIGAMPQFLPPQVPFSFAAAVVQVAKGRELEVLKRTAHLPEKADARALASIKERLEAARKWVEKYAPEEYKLKLLPHAPDIHIPSAVEEIFFEVAERLKKGVDGEKIQTYIHSQAKAKNIPPAQVFSLAYQLILGKERGPRLGPFLVSLEKSFVIPRLRRER
jgi:lysyl-tRNA synthetase class 1